MSQVKPNKNTAAATNQKAIQGVGKHFAKVKTLTLAGESYTPASLKAVLQGEIDANNALDQARAQMREQVSTTRTVRAKARAAREGLRAYVLGNYGANAVQMLEDFGMSAPRHKGPKTAEAKAQAAAKAKVTRAARKAAKLAVATVPNPAAPAATPAHVVQASPPAQTAAPAATSTPAQ